MVNKGGAKYRIEVTCAPATVRRPDFSRPTGGDIAPPPLHDGRRPSRRPLDYWITSVTLTPGGTTTDSR